MKCGDKGYPESQSLPDQYQIQAGITSAEQRKLHRCCQKITRAFVSQEISVPLKSIYSLVYLLDVCTLPFPAHPVGISWDVAPICCFLSCKAKAVLSRRVRIQWMAITQPWRIISKQAFFCGALSYCLVEILFSIPQYLFGPDFLSSHQ